MVSTSRIREKKKPKDSSVADRKDGPPRPELLLRVAQSAKQQKLRRVLPGGIESLWWGVVDSGPTAADLEVMQELMGLLVAREAGPHTINRAHDVSDLVHQATVRPTSAVLLILWAYTLPELTQVVDETVWWRILEELQTLCQSASEQTRVDSWQRLIIAGELTAVLAWRLQELPSCRAYLKTSRKAFESWASKGDASVTQTLMGGGVHAKLIVASILRQIALRDQLEKGNLRKNHRATVRKILEAAVVLNRTDGSAACSRRTSDEDSSTEEKKFWKTAAKAFELDGIWNAYKQSLGKRPDDHRLSSEVGLPEAFTVQPDAALMGWRHSWHCSHGRLFLHYGSNDTQLELGSGPSLLFNGSWKTDVLVEGTPIIPKSGWEQNCWFTDDEVHYFELQRHYEGNIRVQRQCLLLRDHQVLALAEGVLANEGQRIEYQVEYPMSEGIVARNESETREIILADAKKDRAVVIPLGLNEWRISRSPGSLGVENDKLRLQMSGVGRLDAALAFDLKPRRFSAPRTWRQLTVGENLKIVTRDVAVGYRLQLDEDQWLIYRTLAPPGNRTVLGKNLSIDYFVGHLDPSDGFYEEILNIESDDFQS